MHQGFQNLDRACFCYTRKECSIAAPSKVHLTNREICNPFHLHCYLSPLHIPYLLDDQSDNDNTAWLPFHSLFDFLPFFSSYVVMQLKVCDRQGYLSTEAPWILSMCIQNIKKASKPENTRKGCHRWHLFSCCFDVYAFTHLRPLFVEWLVPQAMHYSSEEPAGMMLPLSVAQGKQERAG